MYIIYITFGLKIIIFLNTASILHNTFHCQLCINMDIFQIFLQLLNTWAEEGKIIFNYLELYL